jgi:hypothetical protein
MSVVGSGEEEEELGGDCSVKKEEGDAKFLICITIAGAGALEDVISGQTAGRAVRFNYPACSISAQKADLREP